MTHIQQCIIHLITTVVAAAGILLKSTPSYAAEKNSGLAGALFKSGYSIGLTLIVLLLVLGVVIFFRLKKLSRKEKSDHENRTP